jgi:hypothetical protein
MEEVCDLIAKNWNVAFQTEYIEQTNDDDLKKFNSNESAVEYIISQLNINFGEVVYEIVSNEEDSIVSFKYNGVNFTIREWFHSRGYAYWVVDIE